MDHTASFGYWLRRRRKALDLTQDALAHQAGCALGTLKKIEADARRPSRQLAERLAACLAIPPAQRAAFVQAARAELAIDRLALIAEPSEHNYAKGLSIPNNLPAQPTALIGREREIATVIALLRQDDVRLLALSGPGGTGKTRLALQAAAEMLDTFADGVWFVNLAPIRDPALVLATIAQTLGVIEVSGQPLEERLQAYLRTRHMLLLLDNFEQVIGAAPQIAQLLTSAPATKMLVTSRATLHIYGEHEYAVPPLALPPTTEDQRSTIDDRETNRSDAITQYESVRLFIARARAAKNDFTMTDDNARAVAKICQRLDGLPLAIELAAARIKLFAPEALLSRLSQPLALLVGGPRDLPARQQTLRNTIEWSYNLLDESEQALFRQLGVFVGGCMLESAEAVCKAPGDLALDVLDGLAMLMANSLLQRTDDMEGKPRFVMLETVREYALEQLEQHGELQETQRRHAEFFVSMAERAEPELWGPGQVQWLHRLEIEHSNMRAVLAWCPSSENTRNICVRLATALGWFWLWRGYRQEGYLHLKEAVDTITEPTLLRARVLNMFGVFVLESDLQPSHSLFEKSLSISRQLEDVQGQAHALYGLGLLTQIISESKMALNTYFEESLALYQQIGHTLGIARVLGAGDQKQCEASLALNRNIGHLRGCADALTNLGRMAHQQGNPVQAILMLQEALDLYSQLQDEGGILWDLLTMSDIHQVTGNYEQALALAEEASVLARKLNDRLALSYSLNNLGEILLCEDELARASDVFHESLTMFQALGDQFGVWLSAIGRARIAAAAGKAAQAVQLCASVDAVSTTQDNPPSSWPSEHRNHYDRTIAAIRAQLDEATFVSAWAVGRALTLDEAIAETLGEAPINDRSALDAKEASL